MPRLSVISELYLYIPNSYNAIGYQYQKVKRDNMQRHFHLLFLDKTLACSK